MSKQDRGVNAKYFPWNGGEHDLTAKVRMDTSNPYLPEYGGYLSDVISAINRMDLKPAARFLMICLVLTAAATLVTSCSGPINNGGSVNHATFTPDHSGISTPQATVTHFEATPQQTVTMAATPKPEQTKTPTPTPKPETCHLNPGGDVIYAAQAEHVVPPQYSFITKPLNEWTDAEKKIGDGGPTVYEQVNLLTASKWAVDNKLQLVGVGVAQGCGFGTLFANENNQLVWATTGKDKLLAGDPGGFGAGDGVFVLPDAGIAGEPRLLIGKDRQLVIVQTQDNKEEIIKVLDQNTREWVQVQGEIKPTEIPVTVLSIDVNNPTKMTEAEYWAAKFKPHEFGPEAKWLEKSNWIQDVRGFLGFFFYPNRYPEPKTRPLAVNGYAEVARPDGSVWFVVQESALTPDGKVVEWNFAWDEKNVAEPSTKVTFDWLKKAADSGVYYFVPIGNKTGDQTTCREWVSPPVCHQQNTEVAGMIDELLKTGVSDPKLSEGFLAASFEVWNKGDRVE